MILMIDNYEKVQSIQIGIIINAGKFTSLVKISKILL